MNIKEQMLEKVERTKFWMKVRVVLLVAATVYYSYKYGDYGEFFVLLFSLYCYEVAYYTLSKEKSEKDYHVALLREEIEKLSNGSPLKD